MTVSTENAEYGSTGAGYECPATDLRLEGSRRKSAFLLLDDAFQNSDWKHREDMVSYTLGLIDRGWQIFYFTMDDHLRPVRKESQGKMAALGQI